MSVKIHTRRSGPTDDGGRSEGFGEEKDATTAQSKMARVETDSQLLRATFNSSLSTFGLSSDHLPKLAARLGALPEQRRTSCPQRA
jgi:hypothetical protein